jgi:S1-C subfamily serine protease
MLRALIFATLFSVTAPAAVQQPSVLHIKVVLVDADGKALPVPRHVLLVSANPPSAAPRRIVTALDGTADVRLTPGNYTVESDRPVVFQGKAYQWIQTLEMAAGRDAGLELTAANAEIETATAAAADSAAALDPSPKLAQWQNSVVAIWSPTARASGFVIDPNGLIVTNQRAIGAATSVEVQLAPAVKVAANVLVADAVQDVAVLRIDPAVAASVPPVPLGCAQAHKPPADGQDIFAFGIPFRQERRMTSGTVRGVEGRTLISDLRLSSGSEGGPVFNAAGNVIGITSEDDRDARGDSRVVRIELVCGVVASGENRMKDSAAPDGTRLPVEPVARFPVEALKAGVERHAGSVNAYRMSSSAYDVTFITPALLYAARNSEPANGRTGGRNRRTPDADPRVMNPLENFSNWSEYVADYPPVLLIRATPKLVEGFWTKVARGAAQTQGVSLPPIKRLKPGFGRMRVFCGQTEVTPIHPFKLEQRVAETEATYEGLYAFSADGLAPSCASVRLVLHSEKEPEKAETRVVDPKILEQIWQDFAPYRAVK